MKAYHAAATDDEEDDKACYPHKQCQKHKR